jgi:glycosyltransferase involved in cell wall biosynthesis
LSVALDARVAGLPDGLRTYAQELLAALARSRDELALRVLAVVEEGEGGALPDGVEPVVVPGSARGRPEGFEHLGLAGLLADHQVQVLHSPDDFIPLGPVPFARVATVGCPRLEEGWGPVRVLRRVRLGTALRVAEAVLASSAEAAVRLVELEPDGADRVEVVPWGTPQGSVDHALDEHRVRELLNGLGLSPGDYACGLATRGTLPWLVEAYRGSGVGAQLVLLARDQVRPPPMDPADPVLVWAGRLGDVALRDLLSQCAGLLCPAVDDGFGLLALEGLALGVPVVAVKGCALDKAGGGKVRLAGEGEVGAWAEAVKRALGGRRPRRWVGRGFLEVAAETAEAYRRAWERKG